MIHGLLMDYEWIMGFNEIWIPMDPAVPSSEVRLGYDDVSGVSRTFSDSGPKGLKWMIWGVPPHLWSIVDYKVVPIDS